MKVHRLFLITCNTNLTYDLKYTVFILSDEAVEGKILDIPNFSTYPTTIIAKDGEFYRVLEDNFFE